MQAEKIEQIEMEVLKERKPPHKGAIRLAIEKGFIEGFVEGFLFSAEGFNRDYGIWEDGFHWYDPEPEEIEELKKRLKERAKEILLGDEE